MNPTDLHQRAKAVFMAALEKETAELRNQFLDDACSNEPELRREVAELLASLKQADSFMENKPETALDQTAMDTAASMHVGETIGPYKLLEEIGEGGMGSVWVAEQSKPIKRKVAIKLIKAGMDSKSVLARFGAERQALAMMDHPNIARVLDGGMTEQGRPYFAMEYVKGVPLTEYCDHAKLSVKERLQLFLPICHAVQHAHQKGIIHRDLKPSNILVCLYDGKPVPKVIDFGLAKAMHQSLTDQSLYTAHGMMLGTPLYMSPEQAEHNNLDIDTRTDIYSLGVILYELLTGSTPLEKAQLKLAAAAEILRLIKDFEPPKPSTRLSDSASLPSVAAQRSIDPRHLTRSIIGDLDWVVMKALEKERSRRYETANDLAADILRHLSDEPVNASPPSRRYRMQKFIKRNRAGVIATSAIAIALFLGVIGTSWGMFQARTAEKRAVSKSAELELVADFQSEQLAEINAVVMGEGLSRRLLESARLAGQHENLDEAQIEQRLSNLKESLAGVDLTGIALGALNDNIFSGALKAIEKQFGEQPLLRARLLQTLATTMRELGLLDDATGPQDEALAIRRRQLGDEHELTIESLIEAGDLYMDRLDMDRAGKLLRKGVDTALRQLGPDHELTLTGQNRLAGCFMLTHVNDAEAAALSEQTLERCPSALGSQHIETIRAYNIASLLCRDDPHKREALMRKAANASNEVFGPDHKLTVLLRDNLAFLLLDSERYSEAEPLFEQALENARKLYGDNHRLTVDYLESLAGVKESLLDYIEARRLRQMAVESHRRSAGEQSILLLTLGMRLGRTLLALGPNYYAEAEASLKQTLDSFEPRLSEFSENNPGFVSELGAVHVLLSTALARQSHFESAEPFALKGFDLLKHGTASRAHGMPLDQAATHVAQLYSAWNEAEPDSGYDVKAAGWEQRASELQVASQPATGHEGHGVPESQDHDH